MAEEQEVAPRNVRGKAKLAFLGRTRVGKLSVSFRDGVAVGPNSTELSALAGRLGRDANLLPFHFLKWPLVDIEYKDRVMMEIKDEKGDLKREYFTPFVTREDRIANRPDKVPEDQWTVLVEYWENPKTHEKAGKNTLNRKRHKIMHTGGSKSFMKHAVEIEEDPQRDAPSGTPATRLEIFRKTHTRKDKTPINELAKEKMDQMKELADKASEEGSSMYSTGHDDIFTQVMGPDSRGRKRCFGRATFPGELLNTTSNRDNAEVRSLKGKVVDVEEELKSTKEELKNTQQQCSDLKSTTNALQESLKATMDEIAMMRGYFRLFLPDGVRKFPTLSLVNMFVYNIKFLLLHCRTCRNTLKYQGIQLHPPVLPHSVTIKDDASDQNKNHSFYQRGNLGRKPEIKS
ncbi:uncharacterized protein Fot_43370 [Forsythia ovata]|uniref:Transposase Tnp1/En/Spm-like domain-containing protein n=1 Tax=Forsythia ovata TaxID=205694 RepID=A0ABD1RNY0_9LAMI